MKKYLTRLLIYAIFFAAYLSVIFVVVKSYDATFWTAFVFSVVSVLLHACATLFIGKKIVKQYLTYTSYYIVSSYAIISVIMNTVFIFLHSGVNYKIPLVINIVLLAGYLIYFLLHFRLAAGIQHNEQDTKRRLEFVRTASQKLDTLMNSITDISEQKKIESVYDAVRNSQAIGPDSVRSLEYEILSDIDRLAVFYSGTPDSAAESLCNEIKSKINRRNIEITNSQTGV